MQKLWLVVERLDIDLYGKYMCISRQGTAEGPEIICSA